MTAAQKPRVRRAPSSLGTVEQLPSGRYRAFYRARGEKFAAPQTFATKEAARDWLAGERADRSRGTWRDPRVGQQTLTEYAAAYLATRVDLAPRTRHDYERLIARWLNSPVPAAKSGRPIRLGQIELKLITPADVRSWHAAVLEAAGNGRTDGRATAAHAYRVLRLLCNAAIDDELITANPCKIKGAGTEQHDERPVASPAEIARLAAAMPPRLAAAVTVAAWSGLRHGELFALARQHVDLEQRTLTVERSLLELPGQPLTFTVLKTAKSRRTVNLPAFVVDVLREHLEQHVAGESSALVFATSAGTPYRSSSVAKLFRVARASIGRPRLRWHDLRHTGATLAYRAGASVPEVQRRLGHTTMRAAQIYAHAVDDSDRLLAARLDELFAPEATSASRLRALN
jgi:integrase